MHRGFLDRHPVRKDDTSPRASSRRGILRVAKFALASGAGFLIAEAVLIAGVFALYHTTRVPDVASASLAILGLDALAFGVGVTAAFVINERVTVKAHADGRGGWLARWTKYQLASLLGNVLIIAIQLALLATISLSPVFGSVVGAVVSYPMTYAVSMHFVWGVHPLRD